MNKESLAISICQKLRDHGYIAYFAGGYVRDLILNIESDDIDIATDATPEDIQKLFDKTIPIGISFGIIMVVLNNHSFEVATFRKDLDYPDGRRPKGVSFCSPQEDAFRRDFTINGMFYDPIEKKIYDYVEGKKDLERKLLSAIGDPQLRFSEDKLRMIRACRFTARFDLRMDPQTKSAILVEAPTLFPSVSIERITQELKKMVGKNFSKALVLMFELKLLHEIFPQVQNIPEEDFPSLVSHFNYMPDDAPMVLYLLDLFPRLNQEEINDLLQFLKVSNEEIRLAMLYLKAIELCSTDAINYDWVHFYAQKGSSMCIKAFAIKLSEKKSKKFLEQNAIRKRRLKPHIDRKIHNTPLVSSRHLIKHGVIPGEKMGLLLKRAEKIAIEENLSEANLVIESLKKSGEWEKL